MDPFFAFFNSMATLYAPLLASFPLPCYSHHSTASRSSTYSFPHLHLNLPSTIQHHRLHMLTVLFALLHSIPTIGAVLASIMTDFVEATLKLFRIPEQAAERLSSNIRAASIKDSGALIFPAPLSL